MVPWNDPQRTALGGILWAAPSPKAALLTIALGIGTRRVERKLAATSAHSAAVCSDLR